MLIIQINFPGLKPPPPRGLPNESKPWKSRPPLGFSSKPWLPNGSRGSNRDPGGLLGSIILEFGYKSLFPWPLPLNI
jgi:hypothetical protein